MTTPTVKRFSTGSFVFGFILGMLVVQVSPSLFPPFIPPVSSSAASSTPSSVPPVKNSDTSGAVSVADQPAGSSVAVESVTVPPPGVWIAVREVDGDHLGNVLGAARAKEPRTNIVVPLLRATAPNSQYAVELYRDDGTDIFKTTDSVYVDFTTGEPVIQYFTTTQ